MHAAQQQTKQMSSSIAVRSTGYLALPLIPSRSKMARATATAAREPPCGSVEDCCCTFTTCVCSSTAVQMDNKDEANDTADISRCRHQIYCQDVTCKHHGDTGAAGSADHRDMDANSSADRHDVAAASSTIPCVIGHVSHKRRTTSTPYFEFCFQVRMISDTFVTGLPEKDWPRPRAEVPPLDAAAACRTGP